MKKFFGFLSRHRYAASAFAFLGLAGSARAEGGTYDTTAFSTALTDLTAKLTALVAVMAPAIVTIAGITLIIVAINWLVRKVRGAVGRG